jgi:hypothetical protein
VTFLEFLDKDPNRVFWAYFFAFIVVVGFFDWAGNRRRGPW